VLPVSILPGLRLTAREFDSRQTQLPPGSSCLESAWHKAATMTPSLAGLAEPLVFQNSKLAAQN
jgi:hypothetical protein